MKKKKESILKKTLYDKFAKVKLSEESKKILLARKGNPT